LSPFLVPPPTSITFKPPSSTTNHHSLLARIKHTLLCSQIGIQPQRATFWIFVAMRKGHHRSHPHRKKQKFMRVCVCKSVVFIVLYCFHLFCIVRLSIVYFKFALMVFDVKPQRCLNVMENVLSKDLIRAIKTNYRILNVLILITGLMF
jgi:hypothetical protein